MLLINRNSPLKTGKKKGSWIYVHTPTQRQANSINTLKVRLVWQKPHFLCHIKVKLILSTVTWRKKVMAGLPDSYFIWDNNLIFMSSSWTNCFHSQLLFNISDKTALDNQYGSDTIKWYIKRESNLPYNSWVRSQIRVFFFFFFCPFKKEYKLKSINSILLHLFFPIEYLHD